MFLALDIGNTNVTLGVFQDDKLRHTWRIATEPEKLPDEYDVLLRSLLSLKGITTDMVQGIAICSVVPQLTPVFEDVANKVFKTNPLVVGAGTRTGVRVLCDNPREVGADRIVDTAAAHHLYGGPIIIVDFGTATVFDAINGAGEYLGGAITPGIDMAANALYQKTAQLRRVELTAPSSAIGRNTVTALQSGLIFGHVEMVEGMVNRFRKELGTQTKVVATGGNAPLIAQHTKVFSHVNLALTLVGLKLIYTMNN
jgi:type III pantothenate kinase